MSSTNFDKNKEEILRDNPLRFTLFPIKYYDIYELYKKSLSLFWTPEEVDLSKDYDDFKKLNKDEQYFIENILAYFASSDGLVNENLAINFYNEVQIAEARQLYSVQILIEAVHNESYSLMIETLIQDPIKKDNLFKAIETNPVVKKKASWALKWFDNSNNFAERLVAFICVEGIHFSGSFAAIYWLKERGILNGITKFNGFISRDENLHCLTGIMIYDKLQQKLSEKQIHKIFMEAYEIEKEFMTKSLPVRLIGMNSDLMVQYIQYIVDFWLVKLNCSKIFNVENPFLFMEYISLENKTNFFEHRVSEYSLAKTGNSIEDNQIRFDEDF